MNLNQYNYDQSKILFKNCIFHLETSAPLYIGQFLLRTTIKNNDVSGHDRRHFCKNEIENKFC
jgi:hypothetical protein